MPRRTNQNTPRGKPFAVEWPEWHLECACEDCEETRFLAATGECFSVREIEKRIKKEETEDSLQGWKRRNGFWYCPRHAPEKEP